MASPAQLLAFVIAAADMTASDEYTPLCGDDAKDTLDSLIRRARTLLGYPADFTPSALAEEIEDEDE